MIKRFKLSTVLACVLTSVVLAACQKAPVQFTNTDITGANFATDFSLTDHTGAERSLQDFAGKLLVVFFGFTQCADICPSTMIEMKGVMEALGDQASDVQVVFITVDPERDTQEVLSQYVPAFDERFIGLRGDIERTKKVTRNFKVFYAKVPGSTEGSYTVDHTSASFVFDKAGKVRLMVRHGNSLQTITDDLKLLLSTATS